MTLSTGTLRVGILAILAGLVGAYVIQQVLSSKPVAEKPRPQLVQIPVASSNLPEGRIIALGDIALLELTQEQLRKKGAPLGMVMADPSQIVGRRLREALDENKLFTTNLFYLENSGPDITQKLKAGYRAFSMQIPDLRGGSVQPGSLVDVLFRTTPRTASVTSPAIPEMTVTLLQSLEVVHVERPLPARGSAGPQQLDLRRNVSRGPASPTITLAVTADQAKVLETVLGHGELSLSPWSPKDSVASPVSARNGTTLDEILGIEPPVPVVITPPFVTETYRRGGADVRAYPRDGIFVWSSPPRVKPGNLPTPNALPAPVVPPRP